MSAFFEDIVTVVLEDNAENVDDNHYRMILNNTEPNQNGKVILADMYPSHSFTTGFLLKTVDYTISPVSTVPSQLIIQFQDDMTNFKFLFVSSSTGTTLTITMENYQTDHYEIYPIYSGSHTSLYNVDMIPLDIKLLNGFLTVTVNNVIWVNKLDMDQHPLSLESGYIKYEASCTTEIVSYEIKNIYFEPIVVFTDDVYFERAVFAEKYEGQLGDSVPVGTISAFYGTAVSDDSWLLCDGATYNRADYSQLATFLGVPINQATFTVPDLRGRFLKGKNGNTIGDIGGSETNFLTTANLPSHTHTGTVSGTTVSDGDHQHGETPGTLWGGGDWGNLSGGNRLAWTGINGNKTSWNPTYITASAGTHTHNFTATFTTDATGSGTAFDTQPPYKIVNYIIKAKSNQYTYSSYRESDYWNKDANQSLYYLGNVGIGVLNTDVAGLKVGGDLKVTGKIYDTNQAEIISTLSTNIIYTAYGWGNNTYGQLNQSQISGVAVSGGGTHSLYLIAEVNSGGVRNAIYGYGGNLWGQITIPTSLLSGGQPIAISAGDSFSMALRSTGEVVAWGQNTNGQATVPASALSGIIAISAGAFHALALTNTGTVIAWGQNTNGQTTVPSGALTGVIAISAGHFHSLALKNDGTVIGWGLNTSGQITIPTGLTNVIAISGGGTHSLALKSDGTVVGWGNNFYGQITIPTGLTNIKAISAGGNHSVALKTDGTVIAWGDNSLGQITIPIHAVNLDAIDAGNNHTLYLKKTKTALYCNTSIYNYFGNISHPVYPVHFSGNTYIAGDFYVRGLIQATGSTGIGIILSSTYLNLYGSARISGSMIPDITNSWDIGASLLRWKTIYLNTSPNVSSDKRLKKDIEKSCLGLQFINDLKPVKYKMIQGSLTTDRPESKKENEVMPEENITETEGVRNHYGFIAQEVKEALDKNNEFDFAGWCLADKNDPESMQSLRYESFIAPLCKAIQELSAEVQTLKTQNQKLLQKLNIVLEEEPVIEETIVEEPIVEEPIVEETIVEEPIIEEPIVEETIVEEPIIEEPIIEESTLEPIAEETIIEENVIQE